MKRLFALLIATLLALPVQAFDLTQMSEDERAALRAEIRAYLLENPEVIMEAVAVLEQRQTDQQAAQDVELVAANAGAIFDDGFSYIGGNLDGDITIVEFMDYRCGYCRRAHPEVAELIGSDGNIRFIIKELPILGEQSTLASQFAVAVKQVAGPQAYKTVSDALMTFRGDITPQALEQLAVEVGLNPDEIMPHMLSDEVRAEIDATRQLAARLQITGTPTFVMHDELLRGYVPLENMRAIVSDKRG